MDERILTRNDFNKRPELQEANDLAFENLAWSRILGHPLDHASSGVTLFAIHGGDMDRTVLLDIDFRAGLGCDLFNHLATRSDNRSDLFRIDLDGDNARRISGKRFTWLSNRLGDFTQDIQTGLPGLLEGFDEDRARNALNFRIQLKGCNAFRGSGYLEVHVSRKVFHALNIGQDSELVVFRNQPHGDTRNWRLDRNSGIHQSKR